MLPCIKVYTYLYSEKLNFSNLYIGTSDNEQQNKFYDYSLNELLLVSKVLNVTIDISTLFLIIYQINVYFYKKVTM